jgi:hypothetical protein
MPQEDDLAKTLTAGRRVLERWQTPAEFIAKVDELADLVNSEELFNSPAAKFLQDAMVLATFVNYRATEKVHLVEEKEQWPDGQTGTPEKPIDVEVTEVLEKGRRRGDEYRKKFRPSDGKPEDWRNRALTIPRQLEEAIQRKIDKAYARKCTLVIYLNMSNYGILQQETETRITEVKANYPDKFTEICVLWQEKLL